MSGFGEYCFSEFKALLKLLESMVFRFLIALVLASPAAAQLQHSAQALPDDLIEKTYQFHVLEGNLQQYLHFLNGRDPLGMRSVRDENATRHIVEMYIFQIAPILGGCNCRIEFVAYDQTTPFRRSIRLVEQGQQLSHPIAIFPQDPDNNLDNLFVSKPILRGDDFLVGFFTTENRKDILALRDPERVKQLRYSVSRGWSIDNQVLDANGFRKVTTNDWSSALDVIVHGQADVILQPFSANEDMGFYDPDAGVRVIPIEGLKFAFGHGRNFVVSRIHPDGEVFFRALNAGLEQLDEEGRIEQFWRESGVIDERLEEFYLVN